MERQELVMAFWGSLIVCNIFVVSVFSLMERAIFLLVWGGIFFIVLGWIIADNKKKKK